MYNYVYNYNKKVRFILLYQKAERKGCFLFFQLIIVSIVVVCQRIVLRKKECWCCCLNV